MRHLIEIPASDIEAAGIALEMALPSAWITTQCVDAEAEASTDGKLSARLSRSGRADIVVRGVVTASVAVPCARCLKPTPFDVRGELSLMLKPNAALLKPKATEAPGRTSKAAARAARREEPRAAKAEKSVPGEKSKAPRMPEYEFSSEEAEHDDYDGEAIVLDPFVREAILLELPNFPLCSESCEGISPGLAASRAQALSAMGSASVSGALPKKANPFEALKHLARDLPPGPVGRDEVGTGSDREGALGEAGSANGVDDSSRNHRLSRASGSKTSGGKKVRGETKIASSHSSPVRKASAKKSPSRGKASPKKATKH